MSERVSEIEFLVENDREKTSLFQVEVAATGNDTANLLRQLRPCATSFLLESLRNSQLDWLRAEDVCLILIRLETASIPAPAIQQFQFW